MADQDYLNMLISVAAVTRKSNVATDPGADEGMGPTDNAGAFAAVMTTDDPPVPLMVQCRIAQQSARARGGRDLKDEKDADISTLTIFTDYRTDVFERDRFTVDGITYDLGPSNDPGLMHHHLEFTARRIT